MPFFTPLLTQTKNSFPGHRHRNCGAGGHGFLQELTEATEREFLTTNDAKYAKTNKTAIGSQNTQNTQPHI